MDNKKNWMKQRGKKILFRTLTTKLAVEEDSVVQRDMQMSHKGFFGHVEAGKPTITDENLWISTARAPARSQPMFNRWQND